jgi:type IV secretory pathway VirJ component
MRRLLLLILPLLAAVTLHAAEKPLPLIEIPATRGTSDMLVVIVSGDGGWAKIDKALANVFANDGMPVVGLNSLQYFWTKRTPEVASRDLATIITTHLARWQKSRAILVGYSRGADVLPAMAARFAPELASKVRLVALLAPSPKVEFEFHVVDWMHDSSKGVAVAPELAKVTARTLCIWGDDDKDSLCPRVSQPNVQVITLHGSHHFDGDYARLGRIILEGLR